MIEVKNITRYFGRITAVDDVSFRVEKGEILGFLGPNAAGKTTTMRILTTYLPPTCGSATVAGFDILEQSRQVRRKIGYMPENPPLYSEMRVIDFLDFVARIKGVDARERKKKIERVMAQVAITEARDRIIQKLSKGFKQRVGLAQALVHDPEVLFLDEPTIGLDPNQIIETRELIKSLAGKHTVILSTHILPEVSMTCQRVVIINNGRVVAEDTPDNLTASLKGAERLYLEIEGPLADVQKRLMEIPGVTRVIGESVQNGNRNGFKVESKLNTDIRRELARTIVENHWGLLEMRPVGMSLEEIFLHLTTTEKEVTPDA